MPRKGNRKVKTGCFTCKIRKIKCDETKPVCVRCTSTGRKCDGYPKPSVRGVIATATNAIAGLEVCATNFSPAAIPISVIARAGTPPTLVPTALAYRHRMPSPRDFLIPTSPEVPELDARAMEFFRRVAGPALGGMFEGEFWTRVVPQLGMREAAVRDAVAAVSELFEGLYYRQRALDEGCENGFAAVESPRRSGERKIGRRNMIKATTTAAASVKAMQKYNDAIRQASSISDPQLVLVVCILFVCIEFLMANKQMAVAHCQHGVLILNSTYGTTSSSSTASSPASHALSNSESSSTWVRENLLPVLRRMSIFPFFFGSTTSNFPALSPPLSTPFVAMPERFTNVEEAQMALDALMMRGIRFIRSSDKYRLGPQREDEIPRSMFAEQNEIAGELEKWVGAAEALQTKIEIEMLERDVRKKERALAILKMRYQITRIWVLATLSKNETVYDEFKPGFCSVVDIATGLSALVPRRTVSPSGNGPENTGEDIGGKPSFVFEMGVLPLLYFVVVKCRILSLRVAALELMRELAVEREGLWDVWTMWSVGRNVIRFEHGIAQLPPVSFPMIRKPSHIQTRDSFAGDGDPVVDDETPVRGKRLWENMILEERELRRDPRDGEVLFLKVRFIFGNRIDDLEVVDEWVRIGEE